jgi:hypothetical protein
MSTYAVYVLFIIAGCLLPYTIDVRKSGGKRSIEVRAVLWSLRITDCQWRVQVFFLQRLRSAAWEILKHLLQPPDKPE